MYNLKAIIIGAGIGGLAAGLALKRAGYTVEIYEKTRELRPAGAGISLWSNGVKVLNGLGLGDRLAAIGGTMNYMEYRSHRDDLFNRIDLQPLIAAVGQRPYPVARTDLQAMLLEALGRDAVQLGQHCVAIEQDTDSATAIFADGRRATGDLLIGADGIHSTVRRALLGREPVPRYAGYVNWNGLVPASNELADRETWVLYVGDRQRASLMPVGGDRFYFFFGSPLPLGTRVPPAERREELARLFADWPQPVQRLIATLDPEQTNRLEIHDLDPLPRWTAGRIALLGDAAHASTPTLGQGGCQALEDVELLWRSLVSTNLSVADALQRYERARRDRAASLVLKARQRTNTIYGQPPEATQAWYEQLKTEPPSAVIAALQKTIAGGPYG